jgi:1-acyl-sn-glycerol-3-phosphate acyltransferase
MPFPEYVRHAWPGAWVNSLFRNEGAGLSSVLIRDAVAATVALYPAPEAGLITFVDASKVRHKRDPGRCYRKAGFKHVGFTVGGLWAFHLCRKDFPEPECAHLRIAGPMFAEIGLAEAAPEETSK